MGKGSIVSILSLLIGLSTQINIFCDKTFNLSIDSVMSEVRGPDRLTFFIGEDFYELELKTLKSYKILSHKKLTDLNETLRPPIEVAFFVTFDEKKFRLLNQRDFIYLEFLKDRNFSQEVTTLDILFTNRSLFEAIRMGSTLRFLFYEFNKQRNKTGIKSYDRFKMEKHWLIIKSKGTTKQIRLVNETFPETEDLENDVFYQLNGQNITAAFIYMKYLHLLAGRQFCQMEISVDHWNDFCQIRDISEWIDDCNQELETSNPSNNISVPSGSIVDWPTTTQISKNSTLDMDENIEDTNTNLIIVIAIVLAVLIVIGWAVTMSVICITYRESRAKGQRKTSADDWKKTKEIESLTALSSVKTIDSITGKVKEQPQDH